MSSDEERDGDSALVRGLFNVVALGRSTITIRRYHVSVWLLALLVPVAVVAAFLVFKLVDDVVPRVMEGSFNIAVAEFEQPSGENAALSDDQLRSVSETVSDHLKVQVGRGVEVWSADQSMVRHAFSDRNGVVKRAGEIGADAVVAALVTPILDEFADAPTSARIEFRIHAFGDAAADRAAPPLTLDYIVGSEGEFDLARLIQLEDLVDAVALDDVFRALQLIDNDEFWEASDVIARATAEHSVDLRLLEGLTLLRWAAAEQTRDQPASAAPAGTSYEPPPEGLLARSKTALESSTPTDARDLFLLDVKYLDYLLDGRDVAVTTDEWSDLRAGYAALSRRDDALREVYVELMRGQIALVASVGGHDFHDADALANFERTIDVSEAQQNPIFDPFESGAWAGLGLVQLTSTPPDATAAIESFTKARSLASPAFRVRYSNPLALALIRDGQECEARTVLDDARTQAERIGAVLPPEHDELEQLADERCASSE